MVLNTNQNRDIANNLINDFDLNQLQDVTPAQVIPSIQPVYEVYKKTVRQLGSSGAATTGGGNSFAVSTTKDAYLTLICWDLVKNAACDQASGDYVLTVTSNGLTVEIPLCSHTVSTAMNESGSICFNPPLKIDKGTICYTMSRSFTAGELRNKIIAVGYYKNNRTNDGS
jgi:hypothetical protein